MAVLASRHQSLACPSRSVSCHPAHPSYAGLMSPNMSSYEQLPEGLPVPIDDGATDHLAGMALPSLELASTATQPVNVAVLDGRTVVYVYPMTGRPGVALPDGWDAIPGARGCTPESCSFRDHYTELRGAGATHLFGLSSQTTEYQREAVERLQLPFA